MRFSNVIHLYRVRLRARALQEVFAIIGIAAGVGLLFASQIASSSLSSSVGKLNSGIVGRASLQVTARDPHGFDEQVLKQVRHLAGVRLAAGLVEASANAVGPKGSESVQLVGADSSLTQLGGALVKRASLTPFAGLGAVVLPAPVAQKIGVTRFGKIVTFQVGGNNSEAALFAQLHPKQIGALINSPIALAPLEYAQELAGQVGRLNRILVEPAPGQEAQVRAGLQQIAGGRLDVESSNHDEKLFAKAAAATNQSTALFAVISALVGFLFAFNAMLLTVPQRRRLIVDLRRDGYTPGAVIAVLLLDAVVLGLIATALGLLLGDELSIHLFHSNPGYLSSAFALGSERVVSWQSIAIAAGGGMLAACVAVLSPLRDILSRDPLAATALKEGTGGAQNRWLAFAGLAALALTLGILMLAPEAAIVGMVSLIAALLLLLAIPLNGTLALVKRAAPAVTSVVPHIAVMELRSGRSRAVAIAATGAIAVFGAVSIQGAHGDLLKGLENAAARHELGHRRVGLRGRQLQPADDHALPAHRPGQARKASRRAIGGPLPRRAARRRRPPHLGDRAARRRLAAGPADAADRRQRRPGRRAAAPGRLGGRVEGDRRRTPPAHRPALHPQRPASHHGAPGCRQHEHRLGARRDHHHRRRLRARLGKQRRERPRRPREARRDPATGTRRDPDARSGHTPAWRCRPPNSTKANWSRSPARG